MTESPDAAGPHSPSFGRPAVLRFVERLGREIGSSPSFTGPAASSAPTSPPDISDQAGIGQLGEARERAVEVYPGPVGELIVRELEAAAAFGFRFTRCTLHRRLVDHLLQARPPGEPPQRHSVRRHTRT